VTLRVVTDAPLKKRVRARRERLFTLDQERALRAALKSLRGVHGGWHHLAGVMGMALGTLKNAASGRVHVSAETAIRAARAAKKPLEALLSPGPRKVAA
jgi:hypothetical protein